MAAIIYCSNTGSAKKYAQMLSERLDLACYCIEEKEKAGADEEIIFIGWVMAGAIQGLKELRDTGRSISCICAVGLGRDDKTKESIREKNEITEPLFLLQGDFHIDRLKGMYKMMMSMMMKMVRSKLKESQTPDCDKMLKAFENGVDMVSEEQLTEVIEFLS